MVLPPGPLRLRRAFAWKNLGGGALLLAIGVGAAIGYAWWQYDVFVALLDEGRTWATGVPALNAEVQGQVTTTKVVFHSYDLDVRYVAADGSLHRSKLSFETLGGEIDQSEAAVVRHRPGEPDHFALSWAIDVRTSRWAALVFLAVSGVGLVGGSFSVLGVLALRRYLDARRCATRAEELFVRVTAVVPLQSQGRHHSNDYRFEARTLDGRVVTGRTTFPVEQAPLFADGSHQSLVALVPPEAIGRPVVLRSDFYPYDLTADEQQRVRAAIVERSSVLG